MVESDNIDETLKRFHDLLDNISPDNEADGEFVATLLSDRAQKNAIHDLIMCRNILSTVLKDNPKAIKILKLLDGSVRKVVQEYQVENVIEVLPFKVDRLTYCIPVHHVQRVVKSQKVEEIAGRAQFVMGDACYRLKTLSEFMNVPQGTPQDIILMKNVSNQALWVDSALSPMQVSYKPMGDRTTIGATVMPSGQVAIVLDGLSFFGGNDG